ncbi:hypothetical protein CBM2633_B10857 [Cupriavidus taiwanensis]|nr:hypothetical protein CBM2633_B10857 [Cupriavidus taiwanensis]
MPAGPGRPPERDAGRAGNPHAEGRAGAVPDAAARAARRREPPDRGDARRARRPWRGPAAAGRSDRRHHAAARGLQYLARALPGPAHAAPGPDGTHPPGKQRAVRRRGRHRFRDRADTGAGQRLRLLGARLSPPDTTLNDFASWVPTANSGSC